MVKFERNEHGHVILTFAGLSLAGAADIERLEFAGHRVSDYAKSCFLSTRKDSYDKNHLLVAGRIYKVALMPGKEIEDDSERTTENLRNRGMKHYSYGNPRVLGAYRRDGGRWVITCCGRPGDRWIGLGSFVFPVSAS
ncbi:MAG: hypothetical protein AAB556_02305 [Patescibacteria group bacterium]